MNEKQQSEFIARMNARLKTMIFHQNEPCFLCGAPSVATVVDGGKAVRACAECGILVAEGRYDAGMDVIIRSPDNSLTVYSHREGE
jgi:hypothetical protein